MSVYDDEKEPKRATSNELQDQESAAGNSTSPGGAGPAESSEQAALAEQSPKWADEGSDDGGGLYKKEQAKRGGVLRLLKKRKKRVLLGGGLLGGSIVGVAMFFFVMMPAKIAHIMYNLQGHFSSATEHAVGNTAQNLLAKYLINHALPAYRGCGTTISKDCSVNVGNGSGLVRGLYRTYADNRLENKLATKHGIEFKYDRASNTWYLKAPGLDKNGERLGRDGNYDELYKGFKKFDTRSSFSAALDSALNKETKMYQVLLRHKVGKLGEKKYGQIRCIFFCGKVNALADYKDNKVKAAKLLFAQRVLIPRTESIGIALECLLDSSCNPGDTKPSKSTDYGTLGPEHDKTDGAIRNKLSDLARSYGKVDEAAIKKILSDYDAMAKSGSMSEYIINKLFRKVGMEQFSKKATAAIPIAGWIILASDIITAASDAGPKLQKLSYLTNASAAAGMYMQYLTYADEIKTGHADLEQLGSMVESLGESSEAKTGGTASAEQAPLYDSYMGTTSASSSSLGLLDSLLPSKAYAASNSSAYTCDDGQPVEPGKQVCAEEVFGQGNELANNISGFLKDTPGVNSVVAAAKTINGAASIVTDAAGKILNGLGDAIASIGRFTGISDLLSSAIHSVPFYDDISQFVSEGIDSALKYVTGKMIPNPFGDGDISGGRRFDMLAAGADVVGNDYAHYGLGGQALTPEQSAAIINERQSERIAQFQQEPLTTRLFSKDSPYSMVSRLAINMPLDLEASLVNGVASLVTNPLGVIARNASSLVMPGQKASAASAQPDPFGITQYGYPADQLPDDPEAYWDEHNCADTSDKGPTNQWQQLASGEDNTDPNTGMPLNKTTNACLLIKATVSSMGGLFDASLLSGEAN